MRAPRDGPDATNGDQPERSGRDPEGLAEAPTGGDAVAPLAGRAVVRRAPRYRAFVLAGVLLGAVAAILTVPLLGDPTAGADRPSGRVILLFAGVGLCLLGALAGAVLAVLLDRGRRR